MLATGYGSPGRVGLLLPLHWQAVVGLLGAVTAGATAVLAADAGDLAGCPVALTTALHAEPALDAGVDDVLAVSTAPLGGRLHGLPAAVVDHGSEVPGYADVWTGPYAARAGVEVGGRAVVAPDLGLGPADRLLTVLDPGSEEGVLALLGALSSGAALLLLRDGDAERAAALVDSERVTACAGLDVPGLRRVL